MFRCLFSMWTLFTCITIEINTINGLKGHYKAQPPSTENDALQHLSILRLNFSYNAEF